MEWKHMDAGPSRNGHDKTGHAANDGSAKPRQPDQDDANLARFQDIVPVGGPLAEQILRSRCEEES